MRFAMLDIEIGGQDTGLRFSSFFPTTIFKGEVDSGSCIRIQGLKIVNGIILAGFKIFFDLLGRDNVMYVLGFKMQDITHDISPDKFNR